MRCLDKQNFCVSYMDVGRQSKKCENDVLNGESGAIPLLKGESTHSSFDKIDEDSKFLSLHFPACTTLSINASLFPFLALSFIVHITYTKVLFVYITHHLLVLCFMP